MIKKILPSLVLLLTCTTAVAQNGVDTWKIHPFFVGTRLQNNIDTGDKVYYLSSNCLYCFDKDSQENEAINKSNYLSDVTVENIYYDYDKKNLFIAFDNGNLDLILDNGKIVNMPELKDASITQSKHVNHITFDDKYVYIATDFGYLMVDDDKMIVKESRIYGKPVTSVAHVGTWILLATNGQILMGEDSHYYGTLQELKDANLNCNNATIHPINHTSFFLNSNNGLELCSITSDGNITVNKTICNSRVVNLQPTKNGYLANDTTNKAILNISADGVVVSSTTTDAELASCTPAGDGTVWGLNALGLHKMGDNVNYFRPNAIGIETTAFWTSYNTGENKLYLASTTANSVLTKANNGAKTEIWTYDGNTWEDVTPPDVPIYKNSSGSAIGYQGNYELHMIPGTKNEYVVGTRAAGLLHVKDGKIAANYYFDNMPRDDKYKAAVDIDANGNLFAVQSYNTKTHPVMILPKDKLANPAAVTKEDWITPSVTGIEIGSFNRSSFVISKKSNTKVFTAGDFHNPIVFWDDKGDIKNLNPTVRSYTELYDQDGVKFEWNNIYCLVSDINGHVWVGTNIGVISMNPENAFGADFRINHIKVPRNDGTNLADYLLDGLQVNCICVDDANRKWIGTSSEGVFLVSADGTKILKSFNTKNSPILSNAIYNVCCDPNSNSVYIVTSKGVMEYFSDTTPGHDDMSHVYVYPNPVRPENSGLITIAGLMENTLVKIADSAGNVVKQLKSTGGICTWDGCNEAGDRIASGVYYVLASQSENGSSNSAVSKFVVIK